MTAIGHLTIILRDAAAPAVPAAASWGGVGPSTSFLNRSALHHPNHLPRITEKSDIVRRTPHMDIRPQTPLKPSAAFDVKVFVDQQAARAGEVVRTSKCRQVRKCRSIWLRANTSS